jgi:adenosylcobinamide-phosphate synthase
MPASFSPDLFALHVPSTLWLPLAALAGVMLDRLLGETKRWHPLVGFGALANAVEKALNRGPLRRASGLLAWSLIVLPWVALAFWAKRHNFLGWALDVVLLYLALGGRSLAEHAERVAADLAAGDLPAARQHVGWIVSRDTRELDESGVAKACVESTLENGNDAVFGALFWFVLFGGAGAVFFRLANTLDAMWGYKTERFLRFGWAAARIEPDADSLVERIDALLPQTQCGQCRFPGCRPYAAAIASGAAEIDRCPPGGEETVRALAALLDRAPRPLDPAFGTPKPAQVAWIDEARCIGCARCLPACPVDAIVGAPRQMHTVIAAQCTGCELCLPPCPVDCIELRPAPAVSRRYRQPRAA